VTRRASKAAWLAAVPFLVFAAGALWRPAATRTDIPVLSEERLVMLEGFVPTVSLLSGADYDFICLLGPYDEAVIQFSDDMMPAELRLDLLAPIFPIGDGEFHIVGLTATKADFNTYDRRGMDVLSGFADLDPTARHVRENRTLCGRTEDVSFYLLPKGKRRPTGIGLIETRVPPL
jgi:hypothetical protein